MFNFSKSILPNLAATSAHGLFASRTPDFRVCISSAECDEALLRLPDVLSEGDREHAKKYASQDERLRWMATRSLLRLALSACNADRIPPSQWRFETEASGKPCVASELPNIYFSVAHCDVGSAIALSKAGKIGIDLERLDHPIDRATLKHFVSPAEGVALLRKRGRERAEAFLRLWTLKEAHAKRLGVGLSADFASKEFDFSSHRFVGKGSFLTATTILKGHRCQMSVALPYAEAACGASEHADDQAGVWESAA